jgi:iron-sulfur cluster assembly protein
MNIIKISAEAENHLATWLKKEEGGGIYLSMKKQGCSGWQYHLEAIGEKPSGVIEQVCEKFILYIQSGMIHKMEGTQIDLEKMSLGQKKIVFNNPRAKGKCGCGESFQWDEHAS